MCAREKIIGKPFAKPTENHLQNQWETNVWLRVFHVILLPLYSGGEVWEGIWNKTHLLILNFCLERLHHVTISHDKCECFMQKCKNKPSI